MKIVVVNKFYYNRGGDCIATMALEKVLKEHGHEVAIYSMSYPLNMDSEWSRYFAPEVNFSSSLFGKIKAFDRIFKSHDIKQSFSRLLDDFNPDIVHLNNIHSYLSPYMAEIAHKRGIKVFWTLHDYKLVCPSYLCLRDGKVCTDCIGSPVNVLRNKCMKGSFIQSLVGYLESIYWNKDVLNKYVDKFITPSDFMKNLMLSAGYDARKVYTLPHYMSREVGLINVETARDDYYCYVGRFSEEKGIKTLVNVAKSLPYKLLLIGDGPLKEDLEEMSVGSDNITFVGFKQWDELKPILSKAKFMVTPSECYEVFGLVNIEAQALGTPVLGADIGGIPETITEGITGLLFESGNENSLRNKIIEMFGLVFDYNKISEVSMDKYSSALYYDKLIDIYNK